MSKKVYRSNSLTLDEQDQLLAHASTFEDLALFRLALATGIRREDIVGIDIGQINLEKRELTFWEAKKRRFWTVPLPVSVVQELTRYINTLPSGTRKLFQFSGRTAYNKLQAGLRRAGITKEMSFHDLRRTFVKTAKKRGLSPKAVCQITGDTLAVIQEHYENMDMDELRQEVDKL